MAVKLEHVRAMAFTHLLPLQSGSFDHSPSTPQWKESLSLNVEVRYPSSQWISTISLGLKIFLPAGNLVVPVETWCGSMHVFSADQAYK